ncbi:MAG: hypothetical protein M3Q65_21415 [Chloroflexota bacterium]|nr:hypothetical protein [Chloroflexota bacterium]
MTGPAHSNATVPFVIALGSRRVVHIGVTRHPTDAWVAQQLCEATPFGQQPRHLIHDNDSKYGRAFARVAAASGITGKWQNSVLDRPTRGKPLEKWGRALQIAPLCGRHSA